MFLARQDQHLETLVGADEGIHHADGVARVDIVVHVAVHEQQVALEVLGQGLVLVHAVVEGGVALGGNLLENAVVLFAPPAVVHAVVVVAGAGDGCLEEVGVLENGCRGHEAATAVTVDTHAGDVDERMACSQLLDGIFLVLQAVVAQVAVAEVVVPFGTVRVAAAVTHGDDDKADLGQAVLAGETAAPSLGVTLDLRTRIDVVDDRVGLGGVEVIGLVHITVEVRDAVGRLDLERGRELVAGCEQLGEIGGVQGADLAAVRVEDRRHRGAVHAGIGTHEIAGVVAETRHGGVIAGFVDALHPLAVEAHTIDVAVVGVLLLVHAHGEEKDGAALLIHR